MKLKRVCENKVNKYVNEVYLIFFDVMYKLKLIEIIDFKIDGKVVMEINLVMEYLYFL